MTADEIREHVRIHVVEWAKRRGASTLDIPAEGNSEIMQVSVAEVVAALSDPVFEALCGIERIETTGSTAGLTVLTYRLSRSVKNA